MMYRCCIFDLDGTLINTVYALTRTINLTLEDFGLEAIGFEETKRFVGDGYKNFVIRAFAFRGEEREEILEKAYPVYNRHFQANCLYHIKAYDGMKELLDYLKEKGIRIAVLTNKGQAQASENIDSVFGQGYFDMVTGEQEGLKRKPDPSGALHTAAALGMKPEECLYLGDTNTDMRTGLAAGMDTVGVTWGFREREELLQFHPRYMADHPLEIRDIIEGKEAE